MRTFFESLPLPRAIRSARVSGDSAYRAATLAAALLLVLSVAI